MSEPSSAAEIEELLRANPALRALIRDALPLVYFCRDSILPNGYTFPPQFAESVVLTAEGSAVEQLLYQRFPGTKAADGRAALFALLFWHGLLVDLDKTDLDPLVESVSRAVASKEIVYPLLYGTDLYDRYFELFGAKRVVSSQETTQRLLDGQAQGVFQVGAIVSGPLGLIRSEAERFLPPTNFAPIAHCRDPGCNSIHPIGLVTGTTPAGTAFRGIQEVLVSELGPPSAWYEPQIDILIPDQVHFEDIHVGGLVDLLGNGLGDSEIRQLTSHVLTENHGGTRELLKSRIGKKAERPAGEIVVDLDRAGCLQLLLLATDDLLVESVEQLVDADEIVIPATEIRSSPWSNGPNGFWSSKAELSALGVRSASPYRDLPVLRLKRLLRRLYSTEDLAWRLVELPGEDVEQKLERLISDTDPLDIVNRYLLDSQELFTRSVDFLQYGRFPQPTSSEDRESVSKRIVWKLGFDVHQFPTLPGTFRRRLQAFKEIVNAGPIDSEEREEQVRSVGVNLFVSLEDILDESLGFATWALLADHYGRPRRSRFVYRRSEARQVMADVLGGFECAGSEPLEMAATGRNNLHGLIFGFRALSEISASVLADGESETYRRPADQCPRWSFHSEVLMFPFVHTVPLLDLDVNAARLLVDELEKVAKVLISGEVKDVRNRVPHAGGEFPAQQRLNLAISAMDEAVSVMESLGAVPLVFRRREVTRDTFGRRVTVLEDYLGRQVVLRSDELARCDLPGQHEQQVVFRAAAIAGTPDHLRFRVAEDSDFSDMWRHFPRWESASGWSKGAQGAQEAEEATARSG